MPEYLSAVEAASVLGCSETLIRARIRTGELAASKHKGKWRILRADLDQQDRPHQTDSDRTGSSNQTESNHRIEPVRTESNTAWRDDLLAQVARLEAREDALHEEAGRREAAAAQREERAKARIVDLERAATVREGRIADMEAAHADMATAHAAEASDLRGQVAILEAKVRSTLEERAEENGRLAHRIADLVTAHTEMQARVVELQPVAERVPMLVAAVDEKDAALTDRERALQARDQELRVMREDIEAIASRPVAGPVFRYLTKGRLRR